VQTGGHPTRLIAAFCHPQSTVKDELPFDARTSFVPESPAGDKPSTSQAVGS
jgi:hypothetical protein